MKALAMSQYVLAKFDDAGDLITNKKLQKILYYIEAWSLVYSGSVIDEDFEAWVHGPVIPNVYHEYKGFGYSPINLNYIPNYDSTEFIKNFETYSHLNSKQIELANEVIDKYGVLTSQELELLSHSEKPWLDARKKLAHFEHCSEIIDKKTIKEYFSSLIEK